MNRENDFGIIDFGIILTLALLPFYPFYLMGMLVIHLFLFLCHLIPGIVNVIVLLFEVICSLVDIVFELFGIVVHSQDKYVQENIEDLKKFQNGKFEKLINHCLYDNIDDKDFVRAFKTGTLIEDYKKVLFDDGNTKYINLYLYYLSKKEEESKRIILDCPNYDDEDDWDYNDY